jgi:hypothetical protein
MSPGSKAPSYRLATAGLPQSTDIARPATIDGGLSRQTFFGLDPEDIGLSTVGI